METLVALTTIVFICSFVLVSREPNKYYWFMISAGIVASVIALVAGWEFLAIAQAIITAWSAWTNYR